MGLWAYYPRYVPVLSKVHVTNRLNEANMTQMSRQEDISISCLASIESVSYISEMVHGV